MSVSLEQQLETVSAGAWAIGVSGGADSVALLRLATRRADLRLHVVHLDHELRGDESVGDARFVADLAAQLNHPAIIRRRSEIEAHHSMLLNNPSARYRQVRHLFFSSVVQERGLRGVLLAHHAGDQAETILQRLIRGSGWSGLCGMNVQCLIRGVCYCRPLLTIQPGELRQYLQTIAQPWREDRSNASGKYQRNRLRLVLRDNRELSAALLELGESARSMRGWMARHAPTLTETLDAAVIAELPGIVRRWVVAAWLLQRGVPPDELSPAVVERVISMSTDAASPARVALPGRIMLRRRRGLITAALPSGSVMAESKKSAASPPGLRSIS